MDEVSTSVKTRRKLSTEEKEEREAAKLNRAEYKAFLARQQELTAIRLKRDSRIPPARKQHPVNDGRAFGIGMIDRDYHAPRSEVGTLFDLTYDEQQDVRKRVHRYALSLCIRYRLTSPEDVAEDVTQDAILRAVQTCTREYAENRIRELAEQVAAGVPNAQQRLDQWAQKGSLAVGAVTHRANGIVLKTVKSRSEDERIERDRTMPVSAKANDEYREQYLAEQARRVWRRDTEEFFTREDVFRAMRNASPAQAKTLEYLLKGYNSEETAQRLHVSPQRVRKCRSELRNLFSRYA